MGKKIRGIKLKVKDVNKNNGKDISHTISNIKKHEKKITFILVLIFIFLFLGIAFIFIDVNMKEYTNDIKSYNSFISISSPVVLLDKSLVLNDKDGLKSKEISINIENSTCEDVNYKVVFNSNENIKSLCKCEDDLFDLNNIRYSLDGKNIKNFDSGHRIITTGIIKAYSNDTLKIRMWLHNPISNHYHGEFVIEKIED